MHGEFSRSGGALPCVAKLGVMGREEKYHSVNSYEETSNGDKGAGSVNGAETSLFAARKAYP